MLQAGIKGKKEITVTLDKTAKAMGSGTMDVFATPAMIALYKDANVLINNTNGNVLRFVPPLITGKEEIDLCIKAVDDAMTKLGW